MSHATDPPGDLSEDEVRYVEYGEALRTAVGAALGPWLNREVARLSGATPSGDASLAIAEVVLDADARLNELVHADVDVPLSGPLERIRQAVVAITPVLDAAGAPRPNRDPFDEARAPDDVFALGPFSFADLGDDVHNAGIAWGAAKAYLHQARRK